MQYGLISKVKTLSKIKLDYDEGDQVYLKLKGEGPWRGPGTVKGRQEGNTVWVHHNGQLLKENAMHLILKIESFIEPMKLSLALKSYKPKPWP